MTRRRNKSPDENTAPSIPLKQTSAVPFRVSNDTFALLAAQFLAHETLPTVVSDEEADFDYEGNPEWRPAAKFRQMRAAEQAIDFLLACEKVCSNYAAFDQPREETQSEQRRFDGRYGQAYSFDEALSIIVVKPKKRAEKEALFLKYLESTQGGRARARRLLTEAQTHGLRGIRISKYLQEFDEWLRRRKSEAAKSAAKTRWDKENS